MKKTIDIRSRGTRGRGRNRTGVVDLDITSLLDILVIMLVFLIKNYNSSGVSFNIPKNITPPKSESSSINSFGVNVYASLDSIWVEDKLIMGPESSKSSTPRWTQGGDKGAISPLYNELVRMKEVVKQTQKIANANKFSGIVNLVVDKDVTYSHLKRLMLTSAEAGYQKYKFVVLGQN